MAGNDDTPSGSSYDMERLEEENPFAAITAINGPVAKQSKPKKSINELFKYAVERISDNDHLLHQFKSGEFSNYENKKVRLVLIKTSPS
jgi:hypothetical protein